MFNIREELKVKMFNRLRENLALHPSEAHMASLCVAIVSGGIGGSLFSILTMFVDINRWVSLGLAGLSGFCIAWLVCEYLFPSAHKWYGHSSLSHWIYNIVGIVSGIIVFL